MLHLYFLEYEQKTKDGENIHIKGTINDCSKITNIVRMSCNFLKNKRSMQIFITYVWIGHACMEKGIR